MTLTASHSPRRPSLVLLALVLLFGMAIGGGTLWLLRPTSPPATAQTAPGHADKPAGVVSLTEEAQRNASVELATATKETVRATLNVTGIVAPDESRVAHMRPLARGVVESISVSLGSHVTRGQVLMTYDNIELGQLVGDYLTEQAALRQAQTDSTVKQTALRRAEALIRIEAIAQQDVETRRAEFANAEAGVASARARVSRVEEQLHRFGLSDPDVRALVAANDQQAHRAASHSTLRAPFDGVVTRFEVAVGEVIEADKEIFTLADMSTVWVLADVYERDLAQVSRDGRVDISVESYPGRVFEGRIAHVSDIIDPATRTAKVRCVVDNNDSALKFDMFAKVRLNRTGEREALTVPAAAVQQINGRSVVFIRNSGTEFQQRNVELGARFGERVEIVSGVDEGATVVGQGSFYLKTAALRESIGDEH